MTYSISNDRVNSKFISVSEKEYLISRKTSICLLIVSAIVLLAGVIFQSLSILLIGVIGFTITAILRNREVKQVKQPYLIASVPVPNPIPTSQEIKIPSIKPAEQKIPEVISTFSDDQLSFFSLDFDLMSRELHEDDLNILRVKQDALMAELLCQAALQRNDTRSP